MRTRRDPANRLHLVDTLAEYVAEASAATLPDASLPDATPDATSDATAGAAGGAVEQVSGASAWMANALMYQAVTWVALFMERECAAVEIQPIGGPNYEADVALENGVRVLLRIRFEVAMGRVIEARVEPARP